MSGTRGDVKRPRMLAADVQDWVRTEAEHVGAVENKNPEAALRIVVSRLEDGYYRGPGEQDLTDRNSNHCLALAKKQLKEIEHAQQ